jgi:hypothetical protein
MIRPLQLLNSLLNFGTCRVTDALKGGIRRLGKIHRVAAGAEVAPEPLAKKHLDITFVVDDENKRLTCSSCGMPLCSHSAVANDSVLHSDGNARM